MPPRGLQEAPSRPQECPKRLPRSLLLLLVLFLFLFLFLFVPRKLSKPTRGTHGPIAWQGSGHNRCLQNGVRCIQDGPRWSQADPRRPEKPSRGLQDNSRGLQESLQEGSPRRKSWIVHKVLNILGFPPFRSSDGPQDSLRRPQMGEKRPKAARLASSSPQRAPRY